MLRLVPVALFRRRGRRPRLLRRRRPPLRRLLALRGRPHTAAHAGGLPHDVRPAMRKSCMNSS